MKDIILILSATILIGCSGHERAPADLRIIGSANIQYNAEDNNYYAIIDSETYIITSIYTVCYPLCFVVPFKTNPIAGVEVTCFMRSGSSDVDCMLGICSKQEIKQMLKGCYTILLPIAFVFGIYIIVVTCSIIRSSPKRTAKKRPKAAARLQC